MSKLGIQLYSVRDKTKDNFLNTIRRLGDMGYDAVQFAGFFDTSAQDVKRVMDESGIGSAGSHMPYDQLLGGRLEETLTYNHAIDNDLIICPSLPKEFHGSVDGFKEAAESLNEIGRKCVEQGFQFGYHNHNFEFHDLEAGEYGFNILCSETDSNYVKIELDCYWALHGGYNPVDIMEKYQGRCVSLHLKDMSHDGNGNKISTEIGQGKLDLQSILTKAKKMSIPWLIVEQEHFDKDTLESAQINITNLRKLVG
ncbi:sugar phosphate isomerase/epimerase [Aquibacillus sp. 3ASR75-11]|uniref:Sugar phosphate isomerase/epimerase n=1 Tax=Terrihalobacillus insolitus TaxID=2950438 RepID=A0A9X4AKG0_9BACI|nr:TIM barrel protein [Terrihalobacillus insolitus]MDC3412045.1 sugar phosphate isomerase/epimerase [Terrihalobacillus insolitus]MDC3423262.1 sugar phosphate isomerase/epimerase [Terrihalobacillus insolitus]